MSFQEDIKPVHLQVYAKHLLQHFVTIKPFNGDQGTGNRRTRRQCKQKQPFWMGTSSGCDSPTMSPSPSVTDPDDADDPSFTAELDNAELGQKKRAAADSEEGAALVGDFALQLLYVPGLQHIWE